MFSPHTLWNDVMKRRAAVAARGAFTLVELLVVIMIIGILASLTTFALMDAQQEARAARTRAQIEKIHELLMVRYEAYRTRPVQAAVNPARRAIPELAAVDRLNAMRELMRMEMPERITDLLFSGEQQADYSLDPAFTIQPAPTATGLTAFPSLFLSYRRRIATAGSWTPENQQAECLYMILASIQDGTRNGLDFFKDNEIGDIDGDGMPEVWDGWGRPIRFLRWAPGFSSPLQNPADLQADPFDILKVDPRWKNDNASDRHYPDDRSSEYPVGSPPQYAQADNPYQLFPLVYSAGPDGFYHIVVDQFGALTASSDDDDFNDNNNGLFANGTALLYYSQTYTGAYKAYTPPPNYPPPAWPTKLQSPSPPRFPNTWRLWTDAPPNDPYVILPGLTVRIGARYDMVNSSLTGADDNIDNHTLAVQ